MKLEMLISEVARGRAAIKEIEEEIEPKEKEIKALELDLGTHFGSNGSQVEISERREGILSAARVLKIVGEKKFMGIVKVIKASAQKYMTKEQIDKATTEEKVSKVYSYSIKE